MSTPARQHAAGPSAGPVIPEPSLAERARTLFDLGTTGTLATQSRRHPGFPFASLMPYALDAAARPLFLVSTMAMHTQNLAADPHATLLVADPEAANDPLGSARASLVGTVLPVPAPELQSARELYLERHESSRYWVDFKDFAFYRLEPAEFYYIGGFGVMGWVSAEDYTHAEPDPLRASAAGILAHMNADHADSLVLLADVFANIKADGAIMTAVDRLGLHMRLTTADGVRGIRVGFLREARDAGAVRKVLVEMVTLARQAPPAQH